MYLSKVTFFLWRINIIIHKYNIILNKIERTGTSDAGTLINLIVLIMNKINAIITRHPFPENLLDSSAIKFILISVIFLIYFLILFL